MLTDVCVCFSDDFDLSGVFIVSKFLLDRAKAFDDVDVFDTVRKLRKQCPTIIKHLVRSMFSQKSLLFIKATVLC